MLQVAIFSLCHSYILIFSPHSLNQNHSFVESLGSPISAALSKNAAERGTQSGTPPTIRQMGNDPINDAFDNNEIDFHTNVESSDDMSQDGSGKKLCMSLSLLLVINQLTLV